MVSANMKIKIDQRNLSSFLTVYLLPVLLASGITAETSNLIIGLIILLIMVLSQIWSERNPSTWFEVTDEDTNESIIESDDKNNGA